MFRVKDLLISESNGAIVTTSPSPVSRTFSAIREKTGIHPISNRTYDMTSDSGEIYAESTGVSTSDDDYLWDIDEFLDNQEILNPRDREFVKRSLRLRWGIDDVIDTKDPDWPEAWDDVHSELMLMYGNGLWH